MTSPIPDENNGKTVHDNILKTIEICNRPKTFNHVPVKNQNEVLKMLETETFYKENLSPFNPLPSIGKKLEDLCDEKYKEVHLNSFHLNDIDRRNFSASSIESSILNNRLSPGETINEDTVKQKEIPVLKEINVKNQKLKIMHRENCEKDTNLLKEIKENKWKLLIRRNTHDLLDMIAKKKSESSLLHQQENTHVEKKEKDRNNNENNPITNNNVDNNNNKLLKNMEKSEQRLLGIFESKRLLERRPRIFEPIDRDILLKEYREAVKKSKTSNENIYEKKNDLIKLFDSLHISKKYMDNNIKKENYWI